MPSAGVHDTLYQPSAISRKGRKSYSDGLTSYVFVYLSEDCLNPNAGKTAIRESPLNIGHGNGVPIVVRDVNGVHMAKGNSLSF